MSKKAALFISFFLVSTYAFITLADTPAFVAPVPNLILPAKKITQHTKRKVSKRKIMHKKIVANSHLLPTRLPEFKHVKHVTLDFDNNAGTHTTTVVVRTPLPLDEALEENLTAEKNLKSATRVAPRNTAPAPTLASNSARVLIVQKPTPAPLLLIPAPAQPAIVIQRSASLPPDTLTIDTRVAEAHPGPIEMTEPVAQVKSKLPAESSGWDSGVTATRAFIGTSYLDAKYSQLEGDLENGATAISLGAARDWGPIEVGGGIDVGHGLDQAVTIQNTRFVILHGGASYFFLPGTVSPFAGAEIGIGSFNVFSYRSELGLSNGTTAIREHADLTALTFTPKAGVRFDIASQFSIDLDLQYMTVVGGNGSSALGGLLAGGAFGFKF